MKTDSALSPQGGENTSLPADSRAPTVVASENASIARLENEKQRAPSSSSQEKKELNSSPSAGDEPATTTVESEEVEYQPEFVTGFSLAIVMVGLCLAVLLVALVRLHSDSRSVITKLTTSTT